MKILFFIDSLKAGGKERRVVELLKGLTLTSDIKFEIVLMNNDIHYEEVFDLNVKIHYLIRRSKRDASIFQKFYKICKKYKPDIIHCCDGMTTLYAIPSTKIFNIKLVNAMITNAPEQLNIYNKIWLQAKFTFLYSNAIIGNSQAGLNIYKAPQNKSFLIHNGFNFDRTKNLLDSISVKTELGIEKNEYIVGMVASFSEKKDYRTYILAAQKLLNQRKDIIFLLIGQNTDSVRLKNLIPQELLKYFRFLGKKTCVESFVNIMDICVLATFTEGISNSIMEYMALKKPVIATYGGGTNEIVEDNKTGFLVKASDVKEMANKIVSLLNNIEMRKRMGELGKKKVQNFFSIDLMIDKYISVYKKLIGRNEDQRV